MVTTQISSDSACKKLFRNNQRFAAFFNAIMFDGKQAIDYKTLQHQENDQSTFIDEALKEKIDIKRYRDMVKKYLSMRTYVFWQLNIKVRRIPKWLYV